MLTTRRPLFYGVCLLAGVLLFGIAGLMHPVLRGDGAAQLDTVANTSAWRLIHWALLFGLVFMYTGLVGLALRHGETAGAAPARAGILLSTFGFAIWALNILFMVGAGWHLARAFTVSDTGLTATHAVFVYDMIHPMGLAAERLATFTLALGAYLFGWAIRTGGVYSVWLARLAWVVALANGAVAVAVSEFSPIMYYGQALFVVWAAATALAMLAEHRAP